MSTDEVEQLHTHPTEEEVARLEEFIATRSQHFTLLEPRITVLASDLPQYDVTRKLRATSSHSKKVPSASPDIVTQVFL